MPGAPCLRTTDLKALFIHILHTSEVELCVRCIELVLLFGLMAE